MFNDLFTQKLNDQWYLGIEHPRTDIKPLKTLSMKGRETYEFTSDDLKSLMIQNSECSLPKITSFEAADINNETSVECGLGGGISLLDSVLNILGIPKVGIKSSVNNIRKISYSFENVIGKNIKLKELEKFLVCSDPINDCPTTAEDLEKDRTAVITSVFYSNTINIKAYDKNGASIDLNIPVIKELIEANAHFNVSSSHKDEIKISNKNKSYAFRLKAVRLFYKHGKYTCYKSVPHGNVKGKSIEGINLPDLNVEWLMTDGNITILE